MVCTIINAGRSQLHVKRLFFVTQGGEVGEYNGKLKERIDMRRQKWNRNLKSGFNLSGFGSY
ncbi:hypothetical protein KZO01_21250 [Kurthia zopfii]|nr:hypothetical protein KZO01_21250 [Kurthia zopfii]